MNLESNKISIEKPIKEVFEFLINIKNFEQLMPKDIQKFEADGNSFLFVLKGMPEIRLILKEKTEFSNITFGAAGGKFPFTLVVNIKEISENKSEVQLLFNGYFNPMVTIMVKKPLGRFIDVLSSNLSDI